MGRSLLTQVLDTHTAAQGGGDAAAMAASLAEDEFLLWPGGSLVRGRISLEELFQSWIALGVRGETLETIEIRVDGMLGFRAGSRSLAQKRADGSPGSHGGKFLDVFLRQDDGSWLRQPIVISSDQAE